MATDLDERIARLAATDGLHAIAYALLQLAATTALGAGRHVADTSLDDRLTELDDKMAAIDDKIDAMTATLGDRLAELDEKIGALDDKIDDMTGTLSDRLGDLMDQTAPDA